MRCKVVKYLRGLLCGYNIREKSYKNIMANTWLHEGNKGRALKPNDPFMDQYV